MKSMTLKQKGMTLIEMVLVLVIGTGIIAAGVAYYKSASESAKDSAVVSGIHGLQSAARSIASGSGNYGVGSLNGTLVTAQRVPATFKPSGTTIVTPSNSAVTVTGATTTFTIAVANATTPECVAMLTNSGNFVSYKVGAAAAITAVPADPITANAACSVAATVILTSN